MTPASTLTTATAPMPCAATMGASTTTIAPVGPETCTFEPPNTAAMTPATIAVISPAAAPAPDAMPKPSAERQRDDPDGEPGEQVAAPRAAAPPRSRDAAGSRARTYCPARGHARRCRARAAMRHPPRVLRRSATTRSEQPAGDRRAARRLRDTRAGSRRCSRAAPRRRGGASQHGEVLREVGRLESRLVCRSATVRSSLIDSSSRIRMRSGCDSPLNSPALTS